MKRLYVEQILFSLVLLFGVDQISFAQCTQTLSPGANISNAVSSAAAGSIICLNNGTYGAVTLSNISKSNYVTIQSVNSKGATLGYTNIQNSDYIRIKDVVINGVELGDCSQHIQILNSTFTNGMEIRADECSPTNNLDYLLDGNTFNGLGSGTWEGRLSLGLIGNNSGITISNNTFGSGGCSDGIQLVGGVGGVHIGPGNYFTGLVQGSCDEHVDAIQGYGQGSGIVIDSNYFVNNTVHLGFYASGADITVTNNVFSTPNDLNYQAIQMGGIQGMLMEHNTFVDITLGIGSQSGYPNNSGWVVQNNIFDNSDFVTSGTGGAGADCVMRYNLKSRGGTTQPTGTNNVTGNAIWIGTPRSYANWQNWQLAPNSPGKNAGNDGKDMGTTFYGTASSSLPSAPNNLRLK